MLKQPIGMKFYTNISIVRLKLGKTRYEIACYKNKIQDWRDKKETDIGEVLQTNTIFKNVIKGDIASKSELKEVFPKMTQEDIVKLILEKGVVQVSEKERMNTNTNIKKYIANIIVEKTYNVETGLPFPQDIISKVLEEIEFKIFDNQDPKKQALKAIKEIIDKKIIPIDRKMMKLQITLKNQDKFKNEEEFTEYSNEFIKYLKDNQSTIEENGSYTLANFKITCILKPNYYRDILTKYDSTFIFEILSIDQTPITKTPVTQEQNNEKLNNEEKLEEQMNKMKIANANIEKYLEDNYKEERKEIKKKQLTCTKCKGSTFDKQEDLRTHYKTNWHKFNATLSARGKPSLSAEEFDEYVLMNPEVLK